MLKITPLQATLFNNIGKPSIKLSKTDIKAAIKRGKKKSAFFEKTV